MKDMEAILEVLKIVSDVDSCNAIWWRCDGDCAPVTFLVNCNDFFYAGADCEEITEENLPVFRQTFEECSAIDSKKENILNTYAVEYAPELFVARVRKMLPMPRKLKNLPENVKRLFEAVEKI